MDYIICIKNIFKLFFLLNISCVYRVSLGQVHCGEILNFTTEILSNLQGNVSLLWLISLEDDTQLEKKSTQVCLIVGIILLRGPT